MLASDAAAVTPVRRVPGEQDRRPPPELEAAGDAIRGGRGAGLDETAGRRARAPGTQAGRFSLGEDSPVSPGLVPLTATPSAAFTAQSIHQEAMGAGLHIEPWSDAIDAYRRADAGHVTPMLTQVAV